jgi:hypothetical protein
MANKLEGKVLNLIEQKLNDVNVNTIPKKILGDLNAQLATLVSSGKLTIQDADQLTAALATSSDEAIQKVYADLDDVKSWLDAILNTEA